SREACPLESGLLGPTRVLAQTLPTHALRHSPQPEHKLVLRHLRQELPVRSGKSDQQTAVGPGQLVRHVVVRDHVVHGNLRVSGSQRRFHRRQDIAGCQGYTETKQRRLRVRQRVHLALQQGRQVLEQVLDTPTPLVQQRHTLGGNGRRQVGQQVNLRFPIPCRPIQLQRHATHYQGAAVLILQPQALLIQHSRVGPAQAATPALPRP